MTHILVSGLSHAIQICKDWEETDGKLNLWFTFMCLLNKVETTCNLDDTFSFLNYELMHLHIKSGICIYTVREYRVCVNLVVPHTKKLTVQILKDITSFITEKYIGYTVDMRCLKTHVCELEGSCIHYRRVIPSLNYVQAMQLSEDRMCISVLGKQIKVHSLVKSRQQLYDLLPITRFTIDDDEDTLYWFKFKCGTVVIFKNPSLVDDVIPVSFQCATDYQFVIRHTSPELVFVVKALSPSSVSQCVEMLKNEWIPLFVKELCLRFATDTFGLTDELIMLFGFFFQTCVHTTYNRIHY